MLFATANGSPGRTGISLIARCPSFHRWYAATWCPSLWPDRLQTAAEGEREKDSNGAYAPSRTHGFLEFEKNVQILAGGIGPTWPASCVMRRAATRSIAEDARRWRLSGPDSGP